MNSAELRALLMEADPVVSVVRQSRHYGEGYGEESVGLRIFAEVQFYTVIGNAGPERDKRIEPALRLIVAAVNALPSLLDERDALLDALEFYAREDQFDVGMECWADEGDKARAAIAKATNTKETTDA